MKKKIKIKRIILIAAVVIAVTWMIYINVYPPIYELRGTFYYNPDKDFHGSKYTSIDKYFLVQNPPLNNDKIFKMAKSYIDETGEAKKLLAEEISKENHQSEIHISIIFCRKAYTLSGLHRFWYAEDEYEIEGYAEFFLVAYYLTYDNGICNERYRILNEKDYENDYRGERTYEYNGY